MTKGGDDLEKQTLRNWMLQASSEMQMDLAERCDTSVSYLWNLAHNFRSAKIELVAKIEEQTINIFASQPFPPKPVMRTTICDTCRSCPHVNVKHKEDDHGG